ncbi:DUF6328 family protein [Aeromicrobium sp.]|uniref:DUF6328 family protein n=1 Tax=Aeromicrobium sp. TaxID=1871063 RepID=UPI003D6C4361
MEGEPTRDRIDRNWNEILQELRVAQTGVQILTAFLLTLPFQPAFKDLPASRTYVYVAVLLSAMLSMLMLLTPVALHRALFRRGLKPWLVDAANMSSRAGLVLLVAANVGAVWLVLDVVLGLLAASIAAAVLAGLTTIGWIVVPAWVLKGRD